MNILLTGGTGFIGSYILMKLVENGHTVKVLARNPDKIPILHSIKGVTITKGDITDTHLYEKLAEDKDACIYVTLNYNDASARDMLLADTLPAVTLADTCARAGVKHFIYTSSAAANDFVYKTDIAKMAGAAAYNVYENTKQNPASYYGATKAATENFLNAISCQTRMKVNIVRPGFTFGNPVVEGAPIYSDKRFGELFSNAKNNRDIVVTKNDGTQFIWAGHLADIYMNILKRGVNRTMYFGLAKDYISWQAIAVETVKMCNSKSKIIVEDKGWGDPIMFDVAAIKRDFDLKFDCWEQIKDHLAWGLKVS